MCIFFRDKKVIVACFPNIKHAAMSVVCSDVPDSDSLVKLKLPN